MKKNRILSLALVLVLLLGMLSGLSLTAAAADTITYEKELTMTLCQEPTGNRVSLSADLEKYTNVSPLKSVTKGWALTLPDGMSWDFNEAREFYLKGTPYEPGDFYARWNLTLENGESLNYVLYLTVKPVKTIDSSEDLTLELDKDSGSHSLDIEKYRPDGVGYYFKELVEDDVPAGMKDSLGGEPDRPYIGGAPAAAGTFHPKWRIALSDGTLINHTMNITVTPKQTVTATQNVTIKVNEDPGRLTMEYDNDSFTKYCHLVEGDLPWPMTWSYGGEPDRAYLKDAPRVSGTFPTVWEITRYDGTLIKLTINLTVEPTKVINSSQMVSLTAWDTVRVYFDVDKYKTSGYVGCSLVEGEIPPGLDWMYGEVDPPRLYGTVGQEIPMRPKEQFERNDPSGTYVSKWRICLDDGTQINHTLTAVVTKDGNPFTDVKSSDFFYKAVLWAVTHDPQVTTGTSATSFSPGNTCTRAQVVTFLWRTVGCPEPKSKTNPFEDVQEGQYYYDAVLWAVENGITNGVDKTHFGPNRGCTRAQVVTFLWRTAGQPDPESSANPFIDVPADQYYYKPVLWAVEHGVTTGTSANKFSPNNTCTRGQIVTFLYRAAAPANILVKNDLLMYVEDVYTVTDRGVIVTGRIASGSVKTGDKIRLIGAGDGEGKDLPFTVEAIEMFHKILDEAETGDNVGILLGDVDKSTIARGDALIAGNSDLKPVTGLIGTLDLKTRYDGGRHTPIFDNYKPQIYIGTTDVTGTVTGLPKDGLFPGKSAYGVSIELANPTFVYLGQEVTVREGGRTVGTFTVKDIPR